jgi:hypothetical protein
MATTSSKITFDTSVAWNTDELNITDTSTYSVEDLAWLSANSRFLTKIVDPTGTTAYDNTTKTSPDFAGGGTGVFSLPTSSGVPIAGTYSVYETVFDNTNITATSFTSSAISANEITGVTNNFSTGQAVTYNANSGTVGLLVDGTTYYVSTNSTATEIKLSTTYANAVAGTDIAITAGSGTPNLSANDFIREYKFDIAFASPSASLTPSYSVINPVYLKCSDTTTYKVNGVTPTTTKVWTLTYPDSLGTYTSTDATLNTGVFYGSTNGAMNQIKLVSTSTYSYNGYYADASTTNVSYTLQNIMTDTPDNGGILVFTDTSACDSYCCVKNAYNSYVNAQTAKIKADKKAIWEEASMLMTMIQHAYDCNDSNSVGVYKAKLEDVTGCSGDCGCSGNSSVSQVVGIGTTPNITRLYEYVASGNITQLTINDVFKKYSFADGDFQCFADGSELTSQTSYSPSYNAVTGIFTFGGTVFNNTEITFYIIKP